MRQMIGDGNFPEQIQPTDSPEVVQRKIEGLIARCATVRVADINEQSSPDLLAAYAHARHIEIMTGGSGADAIHNFGEIREAFNVACGDSDKPLWALTYERTIAGSEGSKEKIEQFYATPTVYNKDATVGQIRAFTKPINEAVRGKLH